jgi:hypothetical protein
MALAGAGNFLDGVRATSHLLHRLLVQGISMDIKGKAN